MLIFYLKSVSHKIQRSSVLRIKNNLYDLHVASEDFRELSEDTGETISPSDIVFLIRELSEDTGETISPSDIVFLIIGCQGAGVSDHP